MAVLYVIVVVVAPALIALVMMAHPLALQLRNLQTFVEVAVDKAAPNGELLSS